MATPSNGSGNLVEEFEESFQACLNVLTKQETSPTGEKDEMKVEVDKFLDLARQMEAFFLQKRFFLSALKPELLVKEDNNELRLELARKDELLRRHYDKIAVWQNLLADLQGYAKAPNQSTAGNVTPNAVGATGAPGVSGSPQVTVPQGAVQMPQVSQTQQQMPQMTPNPMQAQQMQQAAAAVAAAQQQQHHMGQQGVAVGVGVGVPGVGGPMQSQVPHIQHRHSAPPPAYPTHRR